MQVEDLLQRPHRGRRGWMPPRGPAADHASPRATQCTACSGSATPCHSVRGFLVERPPPPLFCWMFCWMYYVGWRAGKNLSSGNPSARRLRLQPLVCTRLEKISLKAVLQCWHCITHLSCMLTVYVAASLACRAFFHKAYGSFLQFSSCADGCISPQCLQGYLTLCTPFTATS
jgi:hypothetical protein